MPQKPNAAPAFQEHAHGGLEQMRAEAAECRRCDLYRDATQVVFGEGSEDARVLLVGEQPGDREDMLGRPFVGPAGRFLDACLEEAGIDRKACYLTNAVKHFKFKTLGKRRIHQKPNTGEVRRCAWWIGGEIERLRPKLLVALGATATFALVGNRYAVTADRGRIVDSEAGLPVLITVHPSSLLRTRDRPEAMQERARFVAELGKVKRFLDE
ncbi:UdgX family uracil-DNA binding protein [Shinella pollutisoli]|uniref:Type-4 uracil-DNA glycosylase n=1 Tax=Shinella pollutisoli TaxID=2250594 RepID=A0ABV7DGB4_9HYPH|nr:UdgX family uracil-DNA binding protein [Shinella pollutisoli]